MPLDVAKINSFIQDIEVTYQTSVHVDASTHLKKQEMDQACRLWEEHHAAHPHDHVAIHHLALIYHSQAWDLEHANKVNEAAPSWQKALNYWARLWRQDDFWTDQTRKMVDIATENKGFDAFRGRFQAMKENLPAGLRDEALAQRKWEEALEHWYRRQEIPSWWEPFKSIGILLGGVELEKYKQLRADLPKALLAIHLTLILHYNAINRMDFARSHFELIQQADFTGELKARIREDLAANLLTIGREAVLQGGRFEAGVEQAQRLLQIDPENVWGLEFLLLSYDKWNSSRLNENDLTGLERIMREITENQYLDKVKRAIQDPGCPASIAQSAKETISTINRPIINLCYQRIRKNKYVEKYNSNSLSWSEKDDFRNCLDHLLHYGKNEIDTDELQAIRKLRNNL